MNRPNALWAWLAAAGLAWGGTGCGKGAAKEDAKAEAAPAESSDESPAVAAAPAAPSPPPAPPKEKSGTDELLSLSDGDKPAAGAPAAPPPAAASPAPAAPAPAQPAQGGSSRDFARRAAPPPSGAAPAPSGGGSPAPSGGGGDGSNPYGPGYTSGNGGSSAFAGGGRSSGDMRPKGGAAAPGGAGGGAAAGGTAGGPETVADFKTPTKAAETFLAALKSKDVTRIAEATAKHAELESSPTHRVMMTHLLNADANPADLDDLAASFEGMKVEGLSTQKSSGMVGVVVGKTEKRNYTNRTLIMRREKEGWKVQDYSGLRQAANTKRKGTKAN